MSPEKTPILDSLEDRIDSSHTIRLDMQPVGVMDQVRLLVAEAREGVLTRLKIERALGEFMHEEAQLYLLNALVSNDYDIGIKELLNLKATPILDRLQEHIDTRPAQTIQLSREASGEARRLIGYGARGNLTRVLVEHALEKLSSQTEQLQLLHVLAGADRDGRIKEVLGIK